MQRKKKNEEKNHNKSSLLKPPYMLHNIRPVINTAVNHMYILHAAALVQ